MTPAVWAHEVDKDAPVTWKADGWAAVEVASPAVTGRGVKAHQEKLNGFSLTESIGAQLPLMGLTLDVNSRWGVGGVVSLMHGTSMPLAAGPDFASGVGPVRQAYVRIQLPSDMATVEVGKFDTIFGAEVLDADLNFNQTRGALWFYAQPVFHTGARVTTTLIPNLTLKCMLVNGWNNTVDNNIWPSVAAQITWKVTGTFSVAVGGMSGPEAAQNTVMPVANPGPARVLGPWRDVGNTPVRHMVDTIASWDVLPWAKLIFNGTVAAEAAALDPAGVITWYGASLMGQVQPISFVALGLRAEALEDPKGFILATQEHTSMFTSTATVDLIPHAWMRFRLESRANVTCVTHCSPSSAQGAVLGALVIHPSI